MNLQLYMRVLWRFRLIVAVGVVLGAILAFLSYAKPSFHGTSASLEYRTNEFWEGDTILLVSQHGFPWGRSTLPFQSENVGGQETAVPEFADPSRLSSLALLYAQLANSDQVRLLMLKQGPIRGKVVATPILASPDGSNGNLPMINIAATSTSPTEAKSLSWRAATAVRTFLKQQQDAAKIPPSQRIIVETVQQPLQATLVRPRKMTLPIMIFGTILLASCGLALVLENLRPRLRVAPPVGAGGSRAPRDVRKSA
jgi:hypothetical protein